MAWISPSRRSTGGATGAPPELGHRQPAGCRSAGVRQHERSGAMRGGRKVVGLGLIPMLFLGAACGKHGGGGGGGGESSPTALDLNTPVITNLRVSFRGACMLPGDNPGLIEVLAMEYTDADGNLRGGTLDDAATATVGGTQPISSPIPSAAVTISGTTSGTITATFCTHFGDN